jgi:hypothetical protein
MTSTTTENNTSNSVTPVKVNVTVGKTSSPNPPPLINFQLTNPIVYIKAWWKKLIGNEGIKMTLQIKPITAIILVSIVCGASFSAGQLTLPTSLVTYYLAGASPTPTASASASPTTDVWVETAFSGKLQTANNKYFLVTTSAQAITLEIPTAINATKLVGKRVLVTGKYNKTTKYLIVADTADLEILSSTPIPVPTITPSPSPVTIN